ncbi:hypothetical protein D1007_39749 [Hordeum vulgare]|nr:hypothetical protein D1007_39749 [Hordeum vulgare]
MPPKASRGKGAASEKELVRLRKKYANFAKGLDMATLKSRYQIMWAAETKAHPATQSIYSMPKLHLEPRYGMLMWRK